MAEWDRNKVSPSEINNGKQFTRDDDLTVQELNAMVNNSFYGVDFAENMADQPDISEINSEGSAEVSIIDNVKNGITYKKFKFKNLKGSKGADGLNGKSAFDFAQEGGYTGTEEEFTNDLGDIATKTFVKENGGKIDSISINGVEQNIINKNVDITVPTTAGDIGALPNTTTYAKSLSLTIDNSTYVVTAQLKDQHGNYLGTAQTIDLPLESVVVSGSYDSENKRVVLKLKDGSTIAFSVADLVSGLASQSSLDQTNTNLNDLTIRVNNAETNISKKVDKVEGKGLSTNDFTTAYKTKLDGLENYDDTAVRNLISAKYTKPLTGIPKTDLASGVQALLDKANSALQSVPEGYITETELNKKGYATKTDVSEEVSALNTAIDKKANQTDLNTISGKVSTLENNYTSLSDTKADKSEVSTQINEAKGEINQSIQKIYGSTDTENLSLYGLSQDINANARDIENIQNTTIAGLVSEISSLESSKVDKELNKGLSTNDFTNEFKNQINTNQNNISQLSTKVNTISSDVSDIKSNVETVTTDITNLKNNKANKDEIKTKLSEMEEDTGHRTVTDAEKSSWNAKQTALPTTNVAGKVLLSTSTAGNVEWGNPDTVEPTTVQVDGTSVTSGSIANIKTMSSNYNANTNPLATKNDIPTKVSLANYSTVSEITKKIYTEAIFGETVSMSSACAKSSDGLYYKLKAGLVIDITGNLIVSTDKGNTSPSTRYTENYLYTIVQSTYAFGGNITFVADKPIYLVGTLNGKLFTLLNSGWYTQTEPTSDDGYVYLLWGFGSTNNNVILSIEHPLFKYNDSNFRIFGDGSSAKLYDELGDNTNGALTQKKATAELNKKPNFEDFGEIEFTPNLQSQVNDLEAEIDSFKSNKAEVTGSDIIKESFRLNLGLGNITKQYYTVSFKTTSITTLDISTFIPDWVEGAVYVLYGFASPVGKTYMSVRAYSDVMTSEQNLSYNGGVQEMGNAFVFEVSRYFYYKASVASNYNSSISFYAYRRVQ